MYINNPDFLLYLAETSSTLTKPTLYSMLSRPLTTSERRLVNSSMYACDEWWHWINRCDQERFDFYRVPASTHQAPQLCWVVWITIPILWNIAFQIMYSHPRKTWNLHGPHDRTDKYALVMLWSEKWHVKEQRWSDAHASRGKDNTQIRPEKEMWWEAASELRCLFAGAGNFSFYFYFSGSRLSALNVH